MSYFTIINGFGRLIPNTPGCCNTPDAADWANDPRCAPPNCDYDICDPNDYCGDDQQTDVGKCITFDKCVENDWSTCEQIDSCFIDNDKCEPPDFGCMVLDECMFDDLCRGSYDFPFCPGGYDINPPPAK